MLLRRLLRVRLLRERGLLVDGLLHDRLRRGNFLDLLDGGRSRGRGCRCGRGLRLAMAENAQDCQVHAILSVPCEEDPRGERDKSAEERSLGKNKRNVRKNTKLTTKRIHSRAPMPVAPFRLSMAVLVPLKRPSTSTPVSESILSRSSSKVLSEDASLARTAKVESHQMVVRISTGLLPR